MMILAFNLLDSRYKRAKGPSVIHCTTPGRWEAVNVIEGKRRERRGERERKRGRTGEGEREGELAWTVYG